MPKITFDPGEWVFNSDKIAIFIDKCKNILNCYELSDDNIKFVADVLFYTKKNKCYSMSQESKIEWLMKGVEAEKNDAFYFDRCGDR